MYEYNEDRYDNPDDYTLEERVPVVKFELVKDEITKDCTSCTDLANLVDGLQERLSNLQEAYRWEARLSQTFWRTIGSLYEAYEKVYYKLEPQSRPMKFNIDNHLRY